MRWRTLRQRRAVWRSMRLARRKATRQMLNYYAGTRGLRALQRVGIRGSVAVAVDEDWVWLTGLDRKSGNPEEWPEDLRVRQYPG